MTTTTATSQTIAAEKDTVYQIDAKNQASEFEKQKLEWMTVEEVGFQTGSFPFPFVIALSTL